MTLYHVPFHTVLRVVKVGWFEVEAESVGEAVDKAWEIDLDSAKGTKVTAEEVSCLEVHAGGIRAIAHPTSEIPSPAADIDSHSIE